jgi:hypothetical protein
MTGGNGWREGRDPVQRFLRILTVIVALCVFVYMIVEPTRGVDDWPTIALALGAVLVLLGYEGVVRLPYLGRPDNQPSPPEPPPYGQYPQTDPYRGYGTPLGYDVAPDGDNPPPPEETT